MPTLIVFSKDFSLAVEEDYAAVREQLAGDGWRKFHSPMRGEVSIQASSVLFIQEQGEPAGATFA